MFRTETKILDISQHKDWDTHAPYFIVICGILGCIIFFHFILPTALFSDKNIKYKTCFDYLYNFLRLRLYLLTAIGLSPGGSSPTLVQTKIKTHKTTITTKQLQNIKNIKQLNNYKTIKISTQTEHSKCKY
jgi:hypothetical protein